MVSLTWLQCWLQMSTRHSYSILWFRRYCTGRFLDGQFSEVTRDRYKTCSKHFEKCNCHTTKKSFVHCLGCGQNEIWIHVELVHVCIGGVSPPKKMLCTCVHCKRNITSCKILTVFHVLQCRISRSTTICWLWTQTESHFLSSRYSVVKLRLFHTRYVFTVYTV